MPVIFCNIQASSALAIDIYKCFTLLQCLYVFADACLFFACRCFWLIYSMNICIFHVEMYVRSLLWSTQVRFFVRGDVCSTLILFGTCWDVSRRRSRDLRNDCKIAVGILNLWRELPIASWVFCHVGYFDSRARLRCPCRAKILIVNGTNIAFCWCLEAMSVPRHAYMDERVPSSVREDWSTTNALSGWRT